MPRAPVKLQDTPYRSLLIPPSYFVMCNTVKSIRFSQSQKNITSLLLVMRQQYAGHTYMCIYIEIKKHKIEFLYTGLRV